MLETSPPSQLPPRNGCPSLTLWSLFLSFIFCPTSFQREWAAFLGVCCPPPAFRSCFVEVAQHSNNILMNLVGGEKFSLSYSSAILGPLLHLSLSCCPVYNKKKNLQLSSVQLLSHVQIFATPWTAAY